MVKFTYFLFYIFLLSFYVIESLLENNGYKCETRQSLKLNKRLHGLPQKTEPPFIFQFIDNNGKHVKTYEVKQNYTVRIVGFSRYRGFLIQSRAADVKGNVIGSLTEGMFIEDKLWNKLGIKYQSCSKSYPTMDSITHSNDKQKYITEVKWFTENDIGPIQFIITISINDKIYWEKWTPKSGLIYSKKYLSN
ncbi:Reeler domain-containing protein [Strongyloides ratti]|uniref:Reeler domain-containing protein n=1 Tax=Strongyloides ratti TaxID=34506 RepID=A0A090KVG9_STRRB|nr:Reeler domain-containing protein [Strongyloides ratti]CEF59865.1 Reeler domain-containing protein [Strongyloides ratti]